MNPKREGQGNAKRGQAPVVRHNLRVVRSVAWGDVDPGLVSDIIALVTRNGAAVMFGVTSDQGAYSVLVLDNDQKIKEYPHDVDDIRGLFTWLRDEYFGDGAPVTG